MIIEYLGELIRSELGEVREKKYMRQNRGVYMFRIDEESIIDATMCGGLARYINHSCDPNCCTKILNYNVSCGASLSAFSLFQLTSTLIERAVCNCRTRKRL